MSWGTITLGRMTLAERHEVTDQVNANSLVRTVVITGREISPTLTVQQIRERQEDVLALMGKTIPVMFSRKTDRNGYYTVVDAGVQATHWEGEASFFDWNLTLDRVGPDNAVEIDSRLVNVVRANDFALTGERWHAPAIAHYGYHTGPTLPSVQNRTGEDGVIVVYRGIPAGVNPRWGCPVGGFNGGRVKLLVDGAERPGTGIRASGTGWELNNGLMRVKPGGATLLVATYAGGAWRDKDWSVFSSSTVLIPTWDQMTVLRNDNECVTIRLLKSLSPGMFMLDLTLRRGSRFVEGYVQRSVAADELHVRLTTPEAFVNNSASGYIVASAADVNQVKYAAGSARTFTTHANGGLIRSASSTMDFWLGAESPFAGPGNVAVALRDQYIAAPVETTAVVPR